MLIRDLADWVKEITAELMPGHLGVGKRIARNADEKTIHQPAAKVRIFRINGTLKRVVHLHVILTFIAIESQCRIAVRPTGQHATQNARELAALWGRLADRREHYWNMKAK